jgi:DNA-3-methyladenine glycosylase
MNPLPPRFFDDSAETVARRLLGAVVESEIGGVRCRAEIVETEAYTGPDDEASHSHVRFGVTPRNRVMFGPPGRAYVFRIYGMHWCFNAVTGPEDFPAAVLVRAARPLEGLEVVRSRRPGRSDRDLLRGPGNLARGLGIDGSFNDHPLTEAPLRLFAGTEMSDERIAVGPRIGISRAAEMPLRFWVAGSPWVSR